MAMTSELERDGRPRVVIVGAGFGGLWAARALAFAPVDTLLLDRNNYHVFLPLLYQVAAAELEPEDIAYPVRNILRDLPNVAFRMTQAIGFDLDARTVAAADCLIPYDFLIVAAGSASHFFGVPGAEECAFPLKTLEEAVALRNHILARFERALHEREPRRRRRMLCFAIVGGGATGVEFAGALAELIRGPLARDYRSLDLGEVRVILVEAQDGVLPGMPENLRAYSLARLERIGLEVRLRAAVTRVTPEAVHLSDGSEIETETVVWTAGVRGEPVGQAGGLPEARGGRVAVLPTLQVPGHPEVYAIGDIAAVEGTQGPLPMMAPVAIQQGVAAARNILRQRSDSEPLPFRYRDPGVMVILGRNAAVARVGGHSFTGFPAWLLWLIVHIVKLIGFRNRLFVLINWAWDYFFYERAVRLILPAVRSADRRPMP